jgi:hypothetical protein
VVGGVSRREKLSRESVARRQSRRTAQCTARKRKARDKQGFSSTATGIRTPVSAVRGRRPSPLDDGGASADCTSGPCRVRARRGRAGGRGSGHRRDEFGRLGGRLRGRCTGIARRASAARRTVPSSASSTSVSPSSPGSLDTVRSMSRICVRPSASGVRAAARSRAALAPGRGRRRSGGARPDSRGAASGAAPGCPGCGG